MLIQEMDLRLDLGFVYAISELMTAAEVTEKTEVRLIYNMMGRIRERGGLKKIITLYILKCIKMVLKIKIFLLCCHGSTLADITFSDYRSWKQDK